MRDRPAPRAHRHGEWGQHRLTSPRGGAEPLVRSRARGATPAPAAVLRLALIGWGLGHLALGDRRGALLLGAEVAGGAGLLLLAAAFIEGARYPWVYLGLVAFFAAWAWQAVDAYRRAVEAGGSPGGAIQAVLLTPIALVAFTGFWLVGGTSGSPAAPLRAYVAAWRDGRPAAASQLFVAAPAPDALGARWAGEQLYLRSRAAALARGGRAEDLDPNHPLDALVFEILPVTAGSAGSGDGATANATVEFVRQETVTGSFFGLFPTASQRRVVLERVGSIALRAVERRTVLGIANVVWRIESVNLPGAPGT